MPDIGIRPDAQGKVRDIYDLGDKLLLVASDRISAFDFILPDEIPYKGIVLTQISCFWLEYLSDIVDNHLISADVADLPAQFVPYADALRGRFMLVRKATMFPVECIVRGYLAGSGLAEYEKTRTICGIELPEGLVNSSQLPTPLFTPSTKAEIGSHDENISFERCIELAGQHDAEKLRDLSIAVYEKARDYAAARGIIIADTKFEFGRANTASATDELGGQGRSDGSGATSNSAIILADEVLTPDSSRFWPGDKYAPGHNQVSYDKQFVRDWLTAHWDKTGNPPHLPEDIIRKTSEKYIQAYEALTGRPFDF